MRVVVNTVLALTSSCVTAFAFSNHFNDGYFGMEDILNATLAGGVIIGASCDMYMYAVEALAIGFLGGALSSFGFNKCSAAMPFHDTCGVHNLHGMPGVLGGIIGAIMAKVLEKEEYIHTIFGARGVDGTE